MHELLHKRRMISQFPVETDELPATGGPVILSALGDKFSFSPSTPIDIYRWGVMVGNVALDATGNFVMALDFRPVVDSDTGRVEVQTITRASGTTAAGVELFADVILPVAQANGDDTLSFGGGVTPQTSKIDVGPAGPLLVNPGQQVVIEVTDAATAGEGYLFFEYVEHDFAGSRVATAVNATP